MDTQTAKKVLQHPRFQAMARQKARYGWGFSAVIVAMYVAYIWLIGESPEVFAAPVAPGQMTTWGIYAGLFVIVFSFVLTGIYVRIANGRFDQETQTVTREIKGE